MTFLFVKLRNAKASFLQYNGFLIFTKITCKARFVTNSGSCITTELSELLTPYLTAVKTHDIRYW